MISHDMLKEEQELYASLWPGTREDMQISKDGKTFSVTILLRNHLEPVVYHKICNVEWSGIWLRIWGLQGYAKLNITRIDVYEETNPE